MIALAHIEKIVAFAPADLHAMLPAMRQAVELAVGMTIIGTVFMVAQLLLFFEELWWRP